MKGKDAKARPAARSGAAKGSTRAKSPPSPALSPPVEIRIPALPENVRVVRLSLTGIASRMPFTYDEVEDIKVALAEACNNAIQHAHTVHDGAAVPFVVVTFRQLANALEICVTDEGQLPAADLLGRARTKRLDTRNLPESGFGLLLIQTLMDEVELFSTAQGFTTLRMVKKVRPSHSSDSSR